MRIASGMTIIRNGRLVDGTGAAAVERGAVVVSDGWIVFAGPESCMPAAPPDARSLDARGGTVLPGLVEAHFHPTYFDVVALEDLDIKYPVEYVTLLAAANARAGAGVRLHGGSQRRQSVQYRRLAEEGDRQRPDARSAVGGQRTRNLRRRRIDGLESRLSQDRHGRARVAGQRSRRGPRRGSQAGERWRRVGKDLSHGRCRSAGRERPSHAVHDVRRNAGGGPDGPQPRTQSDRPLPGDGRNQERFAGRLRHDRAWHVS